MIKKSTAILITPAITLLTIMTITPLFFMIRVSLLKPPEEAGFYIPDTFTFQNYGLIFDNYGISIILKTIIFALEITFITIFNKSNAKTIKCFFINSIINKCDLI